ncbi:MAG: transaldolase [Chloroflexi bacterium]|nr:transaldolase [Chloroflexota bacterium]
MTNRLRQLEARGQSVWQDNLTRDQLASGQLRRLIDEDGISGVTSNPSIFEKAIGGSDDYDDAIRRLARGGKDAPAILDALIIRDIQDAADVLRPTWERTDGADGFVSIEVAAGLARDTEGSITEARRLWTLVNRPNIFVKIPGATEGWPAIMRCLAEGMNINITLLFSLDHYEAVAQAYLEALEKRVEVGLPVDRLASVASFFVSRVDTIVDKAIDDRLEAIADPAAEATLKHLRGQVAIANAKLAYARFREIFAPDNARWQRLAARGARVQRPLWASTSTKDPAYRDVRYVEELIAPQTVNTLPNATIDAFRDHGEVRGDTAMEDTEAARATIRTLRNVGIDLDELTTRLEADGIAQFMAAWDTLTRGTATKVAALRATATASVR